MKKLLITISIATNSIFSTVGVNNYRSDKFTKCDFTYVFENAIDFKNEISNCVDDVIEEANKVDMKEVEVKYDSSVKSYMDRDSITDRNSMQYEILSQSKCDENGHYYQNYKGEKYYCIALGSYFGKIGTKYKFVLDNGNEINVIKCDEKSDRHTEDGYIHKNDMSVIEFIINEEKAKGYYPCNNGYVNDGNFNNCDRFNGNIYKIFKID